eukprot:g26468.t1
MAQTLLACEQNDEEQWRLSVDGGPADLQSVVQSDTTTLAAQYLADVSVAVLALGCESKIRSSVLPLVGVGKALGGGPAMALFEEPSTLRSSSEKPSPLPKRPRVSFTTVSMRTFNGDDPKTLSSPTERALSPMADGLAPAEDSQEIISDHLRSPSMRSKHVSINEPNHLERVLLKQASPMRTPTAYAEQETSPLPENWDLYKQFKSSQAASGATTRGAGGSPELKSTSHRISPHPGAFCAAALRSAVPPPAPAVAPLPTRGLTRPSKCSPRRSPDTVDMSGVVRSIQLGPQDSIDSAVPEGRKSFATFQSLEPGPEIYAVKQASRCLQEPLVRSKAMQRHQHHRIGSIMDVEHHGRGKSWT